MTANMTSWWHTQLSTYITMYKDSGPLLPIWGASQAIKHVCRSLSFSLPNSFPPSQILLYPIKKLHFHFALQHPKTLVDRVSFVDLENLNYDWIFFFPERTSTTGLNYRITLRTTENKTRLVT